MTEPVTLEFIARQLDRVVVEMGSFCDDMRVLTAIALRVDGSVTALLNEMRETHAQIARMNDRLLKLEETR